MYDPYGLSGVEGGAFSVQNLDPLTGAPIGATTFGQFPSSSVATGVLPSLPALTANQYVAQQFGSPGLAGPSGAAGGAFSSYVPLSSGSGVGQAGGAITQGAGPSYTPANDPSSPAPAGGVGFAQGSLADYFARAVIIILGFIFVGIGLNMLRPGTIAVLPGSH